MEIKAIENFKKNNEIYKRLVKVKKEDVASLSEEERWLYEADLKYVRDTLNQIRTAYYDGFEKGLEEVRKERKLIIAQKMLDGGIDLMMISNFTGLSIEEINNL